MFGKKTRYEEIKEQSVEDMAAFLSWYFDCDRCPAKKEKCSEDCSFCMDAITEWLKEEGQL
jgi:hypothetical protein